MRVHGTTAEGMNLAMIWPHASSGTKVLALDFDISDEQVYCQYPLTWEYWLYNSPALEQQ